MEYWSAIVQIIPVLLLAMVVEARLVRLDQWNRRLDRPEVRKMLREQEGRFYYFNFRFARVLAHPVTNLIYMCVVVCALLLVELEGLNSLLNHEEPTRVESFIANLFILVGFFAVIVYPIVGRIAQHNVLSGIAGFDKSDETDET